MALTGSRSLKKNPIPYFFYRIVKFSSLSREIPIWSFYFSLLRNIITRWIFLQDWCGTLGLLSVDVNFLVLNSDSLREYFGEGVAFYFGFLDTFTWSLVFPAVIGAIHNHCVKASSVPWTSFETEETLEETSEEMPEMPEIPERSSSMFPIHLFFCLLYLLWAFGFMEVIFIWLQRIPKRILKEISFALPSCSVQSQKVKKKLRSAIHERLWNHLRPTNCLLSSPSRSTESLSITSHTAPSTDRLINYFYNYTLSLQLNTNVDSYKH